MREEKRAHKERKSRYVEIKKIKGEESKRERKI